MTQGAVSTTHHHHHHQPTHLSEGGEVQGLPAGRHSVPELLLDGEAPAPVDPLLLELDVLVLPGQPVPRS